jgi:Nucleoside-diphosphate-sugar epimerases
VDGFAAQASARHRRPRRRLDVARALHQFGFQAKMSLREGLERTLAWYLAAREVTPMDGVSKD